MPRSRTRRRLAVVTAGLVILLAWIAWPVEPDLPDMRPRPFAWNDDARWEAYESAFVEAREAGCDAVADTLSAHLDELGALARTLDQYGMHPDDPRLDHVEDLLFATAPLAAVCRNRLPEYQGAFADMRNAVKMASRAWNLGDRAHRERLYRLLYGGRAAMEEAMLQGPLEDADSVLFGSARGNPDVPSASLAGVTIQSGDLLLSRGGAASSALIARGNDFPGNFSHVALGRISAQTGEASVIEAHIESGVVPASAERYLADRKLRILVLRPRTDLPALLANPALPHEAADRALEEAERRHIPYDFALNFDDHRSMFCSEVAFAAYRPLGLELWMGMSTMSSPGLVRWLHHVGVRHFETHEPSDLEYDPQLEIVAEWIDPATLWKDHVDNAVIDAMLEGAELGDELGYTWWMLPMGAAGKAWSWTLNRFGRVGPVPEGMGAITALRVRDFTARHDDLVQRTLELAADYTARNGYRPPYWDLVQLARDAVSERDR